MANEVKEIRARYMTKAQLFEFEGIVDGVGIPIPESEITQVIAQMSQEPQKGEALAAIFRFLVVEAKKRAEKLTLEGERDGEKYWVGATNMPAAPGQAMVGPGEA